MIKTLSIVGNSLGLIIDRPILDLLHITKDTQLEITTDGTSLTIRPVAASNDKKSRVRAAGKRMMTAHAATLQKLAK